MTVQPHLVHNEIVIYYINIHGHSCIINIDQLLGSRFVLFEMFNHNAVTGKWH